MVAILAKGVEMLFAWIVFISSIISALTILLILLNAIDPVALFNLLDKMIGPLFGAMVGVYLGFRINDTQRKKLEDNRKTFFKDLIMHEVSNAIETLEDKERKYNLIPTDMWNSVVNSGYVSLFDGNAIEVSELYFKMQNYNYEAKRIRDATEVNIRSTDEGKKHVANLKQIFNNRTKPDLLQHLNNYKNRIIITTVSTGQYETIGSSIQNKGDIAQAEISNNSEEA